MRIAQLASNFRQISPESTKGIYNHVAFLTENLTALGHETHLFGPGNAKTSATLHSVTETSLDEMYLSEDLQKYYMLDLAAQCFEQADKFDIIHSHFTLFSSFFSKLVKTPTLTSIHIPIREELRPLLLHYKDRPYVSFSRSQRKQMPELNWYANIYHGIDTSVFTFNPAPKNYLLYLGRVTEEKGVHFAIEAAKACNIPLLIAGRSTLNEGYWEKKIESQIDGVNIRYVGEAQLSQKIELLQNAKALIFPTQADETFGLVMIEAMACGTPVIAWRNGAVPEVIQEGETGYIVENVDDAVKAIQQISSLPRQASRDRVVRFFSHEKMVSGYLRVYERLIQQQKKNKF